jgi:preprotein translocase subunit YajC
MYSNWATVMGLTQTGGAGAPVGGGGGGGGDNTTATQGTSGDAPGGMAPGACGGSGGNPTSMLIMMAAMFAAFYFLLIRPQQKKAKEHKSMLDGLSKGDEVVTAGGMIGRVSGITDNKILTLEISEKVRVRVMKSQITDKYQK